MSPSKTAAATLFFALAALPAATPVIGQTVSQTQSQTQSPTPLTEAEVVAISDVPPGIDRALWCASAFYWLAGTAEDSGDHDEAELYDGWSKRLLDLAGEALTEIGTAPEDIEQLVTAYDKVALEQLGSNTAAYDVVTCPDLLEEAAAAAPQDPAPEDPAPEDPETPAETPADPQP